MSVSLFMFFFGMFVGAFLGSQKFRERVIELAKKFVGFLSRLEPRKKKEDRIERDKSDLYK